MRKDALELLIPLVEVGVYVTASVLFTGVGILFEYRSYLLLNEGEMFVGLWAAIVGLLALTAAYKLSSDKLLNSLNGLNG